MGSIASGGWKSYSTAGKSMNITSMFLITIVNFLSNFCWLDKNSGCLDTG
jgi:hypothetical protein